MKKSKFLAIGLIASCAFLAGSVINAKRTTNKCVLAGEDNDLHEYSVDDYWGGCGTKGTSLPNSNNATSVTGLGGDGNSVHGCPAATWGASVSAKANQHADIIYKIGNDNQIIKSVNATGEFKFWNGNDENIHNGDRIFINASLDGSNWTQVAHYTHIQGEPNATAYNDANVPLTFNVSLEDFLTTNNRAGSIYVKFTMMHYLEVSSRELAYWGMFVHKTGVNYVGQDAKVITYNLGFDGSLPEGTKTHFLSEDPIYTLPTEVERTNYVFSGWYDGETKIESFNPATDSSMTVTAKWGRPAGVHDIVYNGAEGCTNPNPDSFSESSADVITLQDISKTGYTFEGWFDAAEGGNKVTSINPSEKTDNVVLYAHFTELEYSVSYTIDENITLTCVGAETLPEKIKYSQSFDYQVSVKTSGYDLKNVKVDDAIISLFEGGFTLSGSDLKNHKIEISAAKVGNTISSLNENFATMTAEDYSYRERVFSESHTRIIRNGNEGAGLSISGEGNSAELIYKFSAGDGKEITGMTLTGASRLFDFNNGQYYETYLKIFISSNGTDYSLAKQYKANSLTNGTEIVQLEIVKSFAKAVSNLYIKAELNGAGNQDWAVIKSLKVELDSQKAAAKLTDIAVSGAKNEFTVGDAFSSEGLVVTGNYNDGSTKDLTTNAVVDSSNVDMDYAGTYEVTVTCEGKTTTYQVTVKNAPQKAGCGGSIIASTALVASISLIGIILLGKKKEN